MPMGGGDSISRWDRYAMAALTGICASGEILPFGQKDANIAKAAANIADAMEDERQRRFVEQRYGNRSETD